ncbi:glycerate kinase family protein [Lapidilactobacillus luobeiensis]|uniref:glycerate kinase family protein n=1 Tax=Lapidilactobacillus luobeiensis TaxID=2950371 RepID=UPI0021C27C1D|nr:glycerate kinase [Lapidilactobacillus luobeiensis]
MKIVAVIDSFKGCATSTELNQAALAGVPAAIDTVSVPIADGGEGSLAVVQQVLGGDLKTAVVHDPLGRKIHAPYLLVQAGGRRTAFIEVAQVLGLDLVTPVSEQTAQLSSSFGLGELLKIVLTQNVQQIEIALGGSATSDGGLGLLAGLTATSTTDFVPDPLWSTADPQIDWTALKAARRSLHGVSLVGLSDVQTPFSGTIGFARIFAPQKGAGPETVTRLARRSEEMRQQVCQTTQLDLNLVPGSGAAGGIGGMLALLGGQLRPGFTELARLLDLETTLANADLVITGEGRIDEQTATGKVPYGVACLAHKHQVPVLALCGARQHELGLMSQLTLGCFCIQPGPVSLEVALDHDQTLLNVTRLSQELVRVFLAGH